MPPPTVPDVDSFLTRLEGLLLLERRAQEDAEQHARADAPLHAQEADGLLVRHLLVVDEGPGPGGLWRLKLARGDNSEWPRLAARAGDPVAIGGPETLADAARSGAIRAVLDRASRSSLSVLVEPRDTEELPEKLALWPVGSPVTYERCRAAIARARSAAGRLAQLRDVVLGVRPAAPSTAGTLSHGVALNDAQLAAVAGAFQAADVFLIHGPPGTGKTTTAAALAHVAIAAGQRVLMVAASNAGADELARALLRHGDDVVRIGHPARVDETLHPALLSERLHDNVRFKVAQDLIRQAENLRNRSARSRKSFSDARKERNERRSEWRAMIADARTLLSQAEDEIIRRAKALCCTLTVAGGAELQGERFDLLILDEASQATIPASLIPLHMAERFALVGDHKQLPPTVVSSEAERGGLAATLFDLLQAGGTAPGAMLVEQHRMHARIMAFPSEASYGGRLVAHPRVAGRTLADVVTGPLDPWLARPFTFVDTAGTGFSDERPPGRTSHMNRGEAALCALLVRRLVEGGLAAAQIGVIAPYRAQVAALEERLSAELVAGLEIDSVDGFQGREKEAVIVSLTRSNDEGEMGFVQDVRRLNVALTRARSCLFVVGDSATIGRSGHGARLVEHAQKNDAYESAYAVPDFGTLAV